MVTGSQLSEESSHTRITDLRNTNLSSLNKLSMVAHIKYAFLVPREIGGLTPGYSKVHEVGEPYFKLAEDGSRTIAINVIFMSLGLDHVERQDSWYIVKMRSSRMLSFKEEF